METAICRASVLGLAALALSAAGCGATASVSASGRSPAARTKATVSGRTPPRNPASAVFGWLRPGPAPAGWRVARIPSGAAMPYPPGWGRVSGDQGTATAVLVNAGRGFSGYLNLTPRQGDESLRNWGSFRVGHNAHEGDRGIRTLAVSASLRFRTGRGRCVRDAYTTGGGSRFIELACLVDGKKATSVIVGAAPPRLWARMSPVIERAISSFSS
jgi:hypothetical protein